MMVAVFATMLLALLLGWFARGWLAIACLGACLALSIGLFLYEVYSPDYGFAMPWLQTDLEPSLILYPVGFWA
jgi:hypothetical protein